MQVKRHDAPEEIMSKEQTQEREKQINKHRYKNKAKLL
jgi:hypothetical protein